MEQQTGNRGNVSERDESTTRANASGTGVQDTPVSSGLFNLQEEGGKAIPAEKDAGGLSTVSRINMPGGDVRIVPKPDKMLRDGKIDADAVLSDLAKMFNYARRGEDKAFMDATLAYISRFGIPSRQVISPEELPDFARRFRKIAEDINNSIDEGASAVSNARQEHKKFVQHAKARVFGAEGAPSREDNSRDTSGPKPDTTDDWQRRRDPGLKMKPLTRDQVNMPVTNIGPASDEMGDTDEE
jgi:hypothetical protein